MDGTQRRKQLPSASNVPVLPIYNFGRTPPWSLPLGITPESAIRSTLPASHPAGDHSDSSIDRNLPKSCTTSGHYHPSPQPLAGSQQITKHSNDTVFAGIEDAEEGAEVYVDTENGNDGVYMINEGPGSWTGRLTPSEDDPDVSTTLPYQAELAIEHLKRAQRLAKEQQRVKAAYEAMEALMEAQERAAWTPVEEERWKKDLLLRNVVRQIKRQFQQGILLVLEKAETGECSMTCAYPYCCAPENNILHGTYYLTLGKEHETTLYYCLTCLEDLWNGKYMASPLPDQHVIRRDDIPKKTTLGMSLDGAAEISAQSHRPRTVSFLPPAPQGLSASRHATPVGGSAATLSDRKESRTPETVHATALETPGSQSSSPDSTTSTGEWKQPPTRFQYLAKYIEPGPSLSSTEKAAMQMWKAASEEQVKWIEFREAYKQTLKEILGDTSDDPKETFVLPDTLPQRTDSELECNSVLDAFEIIDAPADSPEDAELRTNKFVGEDCASAGGHSRNSTEETWAPLSKERCRGKNLSTVLAAA